MTTEAAPPGGETTVDTPHAAEPAPVDRTSAAVRTIRELPVLFFVALLIAFLVKTFVAQAFYIPSGSMLPQLQLYDRVVVSKVAYKLHEPRRGDIVVFDEPTQGFVPEPEDGNAVGRAVNWVLERVGIVPPSTDEFIKRVIALPGETVEGKDGKVFVDGRELREPYLHATVRTGDFGPTMVRDGELWVMGDNRGNSQDSRVFGAIDQDTVVGRAIVKVWPLADASFL